MDVFLLWSGTYEDALVTGVYDTAEAAMAVSHHGHRPVWPDENRDWRSCDWTLVHHRATVPIDTRLQTLTIPVVNGTATLPNGQTVQSRSDAIVVPIPPERGWYSVQDWTDTCDFRIQRLPLISAE